MKYLVWGLLVLLVIMHQDFWFWTDGRLVFGSIPVGLFYHVGHSLACVFVWFLATKYAWPADLDAPADDVPGEVADA